MRIADITVGMEVAVRTGGWTADDIRSGRGAVLGTVTHVGKWRMAKQGTCENLEPVVADYPGAKDVVIVDVPKGERRWVGRKYALRHPERDGHGNLRPREPLMIDAGQIYPAGLFHAGAADRALVLAEREAYEERLQAIIAELDAFVATKIPLLLKAGVLTVGSLRMETFPRQNHDTGDHYRIGHARLNISETEHGHSTVSNPLWTWLGAQRPKLCREYDDLFRRVKECSV